MAVADSALTLFFLTLKYLFGYDFLAKRTMAGGGLFGYVENIHGTFHDQCRGGLHVHFQLWICGHPSPSDIDKLVKEKLLQNRYLDYLDSVYLLRFWCKTAQ